MCLRVKRKKMRQDFNEFTVFMCIYIDIIYSQIEHKYTRTGDKLRERETAVRDAMKLCRRTILAMTYVHYQLI